MNTSTTKSHIMISDKESFTISKVSLNSNLKRTWHSPRRDDRLNTLGGSLILENMIEYWTAANLRVALKAESGYALPLVTRIQTVKRGKQSIAYVDLRQRVGKRLAPYRATVTMTEWVGNRSRLKIAVCLWPIGAIVPFYVREGILTRIDGGSFRKYPLYSYGVKTLPARRVTTTGSTDGPDISLGHKYPH